MKHYGHLSKKKLDSIFYKLPETFNRNTKKEVLSHSLGATLYMPSTKEKIADDLIIKKHPSLTSIVICLEDAIGDNEVEIGMKNIFDTMEKLNRAINEDLIKEDELPLMFIRVRNPQQLKKLLFKNNNGQKLNLLCGFNLPKFTSKNGILYLDAIEEYNIKNNTKLYAMPILETPEIIYKETRINEFMKIKGIIDSYKDLVLNVRIGATDFSSLYSIRRGMDFTIWDINVISDCITDIINIFNRAEDNYTISGPVWEYFSNSNRLLKPTLRETPFIKKGSQGRKKRLDMIDKAIDGLIREIILDKANGLVGKTIIHPSHISFVNAMYVVTQEEYEDAANILSSQDIGVFKSESGNKMNEVKPHTNWAMEVALMAKIYGVIKKGINYTDLF
ncbi:HpcH/HpaI aldolase/citrate lyase family protein [Alkaliphilus sp. B6464]|uniref:HpcH/HpaI aldolase/citrate lyase family protein n=1 Tax=Alkaliphilus sp. B6464 TaxID=2731219 RepID=UPI001BA82A94|nr:HpcH/HpaI aldolase/citrate lyase family protein [Alkaliphilus sp. B6464]QUH21959.1 HpcH/HpaI aldolase/citrate lyase family protein [Alkaliphilus sp. B6464]